MTGKTGAVNTDWQNTLQEDEDGVISNIVFAKIRSYNLFPMIEASGLLNGVTFDEVATISSQINDLEIGYYLQGELQASVLIIYNSSTDWRIRLGGRTLITEGGDTLITDGGDILNEE